MKGDVGRQFYAFDRSRKVGLDVQPQISDAATVNRVFA
jgi:hypothetical protein